MKTPDTKIIVPAYRGLPVGTPAAGEVPDARRLILSSCGECSREQTHGLPCFTMVLLWFTVVLLWFSMVLLWFSMVFIGMIMG